MPPGAERANTMPLLDRKLSKTSTYDVKDSSFVFMQINLLGG
jgi:hypothetical protein